MTTYTNIFGGNVVNPALLSYISYSLTAANTPLAFVWPTQFVDSANNVSAIVDLSADNTGYTVTMPDSTLVSVGQSVLFVNAGANLITINYNDGTLLTTIAAGVSTYIYLIDNSTAAGSYRIIPWGGGYAAVVSIAAASDTDNLTITGSPITSAGTFTFNVAKDLSALSSLGVSTGIAARTAVDTWAVRTNTGTANQITVTNGDGVAGNPTYSLAAAVSGITSLVASNVQIGIDGTNSISGADSGPISFSDGASFPSGKGIFLYDSANLLYAKISGPAAYTNVASVNYLWPAAVPTANGFVLSSTTGGTMSWVAQSGGSGGSGTSNSFEVTQAAHGFTVGQFVYLVGTVYTLARADSIVTAESVGLVSAVADANTFTLFMEGRCVTLSGLTPGEPYWLSDATAGLATTTVPTTVGNIAKPLFIADSTTSAIVANYRGKIIPEEVPVDVAASPVTMTAGQTYYINNGAALVTLNMPATAAVGDTFSVVGTSTGGWVVQMNTGQVVNLNSSPSTSAGTLTFNNKFDCVQIECSVANTTFVVSSYTGTPVAA